MISFGKFYLQSEAQKSYKQKLAKKSMASRSFSSEAPLSFVARLENWLKNLWPWRFSSNCKTEYIISHSLSATLICNYLTNPYFHYLLSSILCLSHTCSKQFHYSQFIPPSFSSSVFTQAVTLNLEYFLSFPCLSFKMSSISMYPKFDPCSRHVYLLKGYAPVPDTDYFLNYIIVILSVKGPTGVYTSCRQALCLHLCCSAHGAH